MVSLQTALLRDQISKSFLGIVLQILQEVYNKGVNIAIIEYKDLLFGIVVSTSDCRPRGPGFDSRLYPRNFSENIGSGTRSTQPREDIWVAT